MNVRLPLLAGSVLAGVLAFSSAAPAGAASELNDAQIAAIVVTANQVDIDAGKLAVAKAASTQVRDFAQTMITDHTGVNQAATELATRLRLSPSPMPRART